MLDTEALKVISNAIRRASDKNSKAYKITEYYEDLTLGHLDDGGIAIVRGKILNIEKHLRGWAKDHPNNESTIRQPEESAIVLIDDLRDKGLLK